MRGLQLPSQQHPQEQWLYEVNGGAKAHVWHREQIKDFTISLAAALPWQGAIPIPPAWRPSGVTPKVRQPHYEMFKYHECTSKAQAKVRQNLMVSQHLVGSCSHQAGRSGYKLRALKAEPTLKTHFWLRSLTS